MSRSPKKGTGKQATRGTALDVRTLRRLRGQLGLTQEDLAEIAGVTARTVQTSEAGAPVSIDTARRLADALNVPLGRLTSAAPEEVAAALQQAGCAPPPPPRPWVGRADELASLVRALSPDRDAGVVCVTGPPGVGKTALARMAAAALHDAYPDGVVWLALRGSTASQGPSAALLDAARALGLLARLPPPSIPGALWSQAFGALFAERPRLLIVDDAEAAECVHALTAGAQRPRVLVTTSHRTVAAELAKDVLVLAPLSELDGVALLEALLTRDAGDRPTPAREDAAALVARLGGRPTLLKAAASYLRRHRYLTLGGYARLVDAALDGVPEDDGDGFGELPRALIQGVWQIDSQFSAHQRACLGALAVFGQQPFTLPWAIAAIGAHPDVTRVLLSELVDRFLVDDLDVRTAGPDGGGPFQLDAPTRDLAASLAPHEPRHEQLARLAQRGREAMTTPPGTNGDGAIDVSLVYFLLRELAARSDTHPPTARVFVDLLAASGRRLATWAPVEMRAWLRQARRVADALGDLRAAAELAHHEGHLQIAAMDLGAARDAFRAALDGYRTAGMDQEAGVAAVNMARMAFIHDHDAATCVAELGLACELLRGAGAPFDLVAAATMNRVAAMLHAPALGTGWDDAERTTADTVAQISPAAESPLEAAVAAIATINLAVLRGGAAAGPAADALLAALRYVIALVADDTLDLYRLRDLARTVGVAEADVEALFGSLPSLRSALLHCPTALTTRRIIRLHEIAHGLVDLGLGAASPFRVPTMVLVARGTSITDVTYGQSYPHADLAPPLLMPLEPLARAWTPEVHAAASAFVQETFGPLHPVLAALAHIGGQMDPC